MAMDEHLDWFVFGSLLIKNPQHTIKVKKYLDTACQAATVYCASTMVYFFIFIYFSSLTI